MRLFLKYGLTLLFLFVLAGLVYFIISDYRDKKAAEIRIQSLPAARFLSLNRQWVNLDQYKDSIPLVLIYFHPNCEHCNYEANEIGLSAHAYTNCQLVMITRDDSVSRVEAFCHKHNLWELNNFEVLLDEKNQFKEVFGKAITPSTYIYDIEKELVFYHLGEISSEIIINILKVSDQLDIGQKQI